MNGNMHTSSLKIKIFLNVPYYTLYKKSPCFRMYWVVINKKIHKKKKKEKTCQQTLNRNANTIAYPHTTLFLYVKKVVTLMIFI